MTPLEFLFKLQKLPPDTPLVMAHLGAIFEMLSSVIVRESSSPVTLDARLTSEEDLAKWLGQSGAVVQQWRVQGPGTVPTKYRLGTVYDWIVAHIIPVFASATSTEKNSGNQLDDMVAAWKMKIPLMMVDDKLVGFFRSVKEESEPSRYRLVKIPALPFPTGEMVREHITSINDSLVAHAEFSTAVADSVSTARTIYEQWKIQALPAVRLLFFQPALLHDADLANDIAEDLDADLIHQDFDVTLWLWQQFLEQDFCSLEEGELVSALEIAVHHGADLNRLTHVVDDHGQEIFNGSIAHLLADTNGDFFHLPPFGQCSGNYDRLLRYALDLGLDIEKQNNQGSSAVSISSAVEEKYGKGQSPFSNFVTKYRLNQKLNASPTSMKSLHRKPAF